MMATSSSKIHHVTKIIPSQSVMTMGSLQRRGLQSPDHILIEHLWDSAGKLHDRSAADKSAATASCSHVSMDQNLWNISNTLLKVGQYSG